MKRIWGVFCSLLLVITMMEAKAQTNTNHVTFILNSSVLPEDSSVFITGSIAQLGSWNPGKIKMNFEGNHTWQIQIAIDKPVSVEYKYTLGTWEHEAAAADGTPMPNFSASLINNSIVKDAVNSWTTGTQNTVVEHHITGRVQYYPAMKGKGIKDRTIVVWLPPGYDAAGSTKYTVVYMHDGQNIFDPATSAFGVEWGIDETIDSLIKSNAIAPVIVVGIYNTSDRSAEYVTGVKGEAYMNFILQKLKPFIDSVYRTNPDKKHTITGGSSLGGLISFMLAWQHPDVFSKVICMSPAFKISKIDYVKNVMAYKGKKKPLFFYIDNGGVGLDSQLQPGVNAMLKALQQKGYSPGTDIKYVSDLKAIHSEASWAKRFPEAITWCMSLLQNEKK